MATTRLLARHASFAHARPSRVSSVRRARAPVIVTRAVSDEFKCADAPGEGKRRRPGVAQSTDEEAALLPTPGPNVTSKGVDPEDAVEVSHAYMDTEAPFSSWPKATDAPGEGKRQPPKVAEFPDTGGKPALEPPTGGKNTK